ncbi:DNA alkylation repair protein [Arcobacter sp. 15-2]|uniref:DNA alkylation repair protein n=1 Tax=Arcobacter sp. 15-2 TaxID=3374109 RepID=UPI00399CF7C1
MAEQLKYLYNEEYIDKLSKYIVTYYPKFKAKEFDIAVFDDTWDDLELKQRMRHITVSLYRYLPKDYKESINILKQTYPHMIGEGIRLENIIFQDFVELYGLNEWDISMDALECFTRNCSSEFAIRQFILKDEDKAMKQMLIWAKSDDHELRRLASEGCRSRLPWAVALPSFKKDPSKVLEVLEILKDDDSKYVQKSVANNINDISKDNAEIVIDIVKRWKNYSKNRDWILKHGSRTLLKASNKEILELFDYKNSSSLKLENFTCSDVVKEGEEVFFSFDIVTQEKMDKLRVEYKLDFLRANGKHNSKVFKISEVDDFIGIKRIDKKYSFKAISTRRYYLGIHRLSVIINGIVMSERKFELVG